MEEYRQKLQDPEFHQNLTKAHVYHAADLEHEVKDLDREDQDVPSLTQALLSYLQDANPFNFRYINNYSNYNFIIRITYKFIIKIIIL